MSALLLDTNIPSESIRSRPDPKVDAWIHGQDDETLHLSVVTIGELRKGLDLAPQGKRRSELEEWMEKDLIPTFDGRILPVTACNQGALLKSGARSARSGSLRADRSAWPMA